MNPDDNKQYDPNQAGNAPAKTNGTVTPTPWWMTVYGADLFVDIGGQRQLLPIGTQVRFYVNKGGARVACGRRLIQGSSDPRFRTILLHTPIYRDDWTSPNVIEGPVEGDEVEVVLISDKASPFDSQTPVIPIGTDGKERKLVYQTNVFEDGRYGIRLTGFRVARLRGDIDGDCQITGVDLQRLLEAVQENRQIPADQFQVYDVNGDGRVDMNDVTYLVQHLYFGGPAPERIW